MANFNVRRILDGSAESLAEIGRQINAGDPAATTRSRSDKSSVGNNVMFGLSEAFLRTTAYSSQSKVLETLASELTGGAVGIWDLTEETAGFTELYPEDIQQVGPGLAGGQGFGADDGSGTGARTASNPLASAVVQIARNEVGNHEEPMGSNMVSYGNWFGQDGQPWAAFFLSWCFNRAGFSNTSGRLTRFATAEEAYRAYVAAGRFKRGHDAPVTVGDIVFINIATGYSSGQDVNHIGIVVETSNDSVTTVEGNVAEDGSSNNGGLVAEIVRTGSDRQQIHGYGIPPYGSGASTLPGPDGIVGTDDDIVVPSSTGGISIPDSSGIVMPEGMNGKLSPDLLSPADENGNLLQHAAAATWIQMREAAAADGITLVIGNSYRTYERQVQLAEELGLYSNGGLAATPGTSNHGWGAAVDLARPNTASAPPVQWLVENAERFGWFNNIFAREPWHWSLTGN